MNLTVVVWSGVTEEYSRWGREAGGGDRRRFISGDVGWWVVEEGRTEVFCILTGQSGYQVGERCRVPGECICSGSLLTNETMRGL